MKNFNLKQKLTKAAKDEKGFTFMEVIIVIAIIMVLSAILIPSYFGFVETARKSNVKVSAQNVYSTIQIANIELDSVEVGNAALFNKIKELVPGLKGINATDVNVDEDEDSIKNKAYNDENVKKFIDGKEIVKTIVIKNKIVNIVVK